MSEELERARQLWERTILHSDPGLDPDATYRPAVEPPPTLIEAPPAAPAPSSLPSAAPGLVLREPIGQGGMGVVHRAWQTSLAREVAVKTIREGALARQGELAQRQFLSEAYTTAFLDHPNIVPVHELLDPERRPLLAMKLVGGTSWGALLARREGPLEGLDRHLEVLIGLTNAVAYAHSKGILHRDIKPANVMVGEFGEVLLMDWGVAIDFRELPASDRRALHRSEVHAPAGTPSYMAPELAEGAGLEQGPWTDVYLLGATLHEVLTGHPPHRGASLVNVLAAALRSDPPTFPPSVPLELAGICRRAMAARPEERYPTAQAFQEALRTFLRRRESLAISERSRELLERGAAHAAAARGDPVERSAAYEELSRALAGFQQARVLWEESPTAREGERRARIAYAEAALSLGDLALAEVQLRELAHDEPAQDLRRRVAAAREATARSRRRATLTRRALGGAITAIVVGLSYGIHRVRQEEARTSAALTNEVAARGSAERARVAEETAKEQAQEQERAARRALASSLDLRGRSALDAHDPHGALACFAASNLRWPSSHARANAAYLLDRVPRLAYVVPVQGTVIAFRPDLLPLMPEAWRASPTSTGLSPDLQLFTTRDSVEGGAGWDLRLGRARDGARLPGRLRLDDGTPAFDPGGRVLYGILAGAVQAWSVPDLKPLGRIVDLAGRGGRHLAVDPSGRTLYLLGSGGLEAVDLSAQPRAIRPLRASEGSSLVVYGSSGPSLVALDERHVATVEGSQVLVIDGRTGAVVGRIRHELARAFAFAPDRRLLAIGAQDGSVRLCRFPGLEPLGLLRGPLEVTALRFEPTRLAVGFPGLTMAWDLPPDPDRWIEGLPESLTRADCVPEGERLVLSRPKGPGWLVDLERGAALGQGLPAGNETSFSPDGAWGVVAGEALQGFDARTGELLGAAWRPPQPQFHLQVLADGRLVVNAVTRETWTVHAWRHDPRTGHTEQLPDGLALVAGTSTALRWDGGRLRLLRTDTLAEVGSQPAPGPAAWLVAAGDGRECLALLPGGRVRRYRLPGLELLGELAVPEAVRLLFYSDGQESASGYDGTPERLWTHDLLHDRPLTFPEKEHPTTGLRRRLAASAEGVRLWDALAGRAYGPTFPNPTMGAAHRFTFSPDERLLALAEPRQVRLVDTATGELHGPIVRLPFVLRAVTFTPDSRAAILRGQGDEAALLDCETSELIGPRLSFGTAHVFSQVEATFIPDREQVFLHRWGIGDHEPTRGLLLDLSFLRREPLPPQDLVGQARRLTGVELGPQGDLRLMDLEEWLALGGR